MGRVGVFSADITGVSAVAVGVALFAGLAVQLTHTSKRNIAKYETRFIACLNVTLCWCLWNSYIIQDESRKSPIQGSAWRTVGDALPDLHCPENLLLMLQSPGVGRIFLA
jgi:hypothetical protein